VSLDLLGILLVYFLIFTTVQLDQTAYFMQISSIELFPNTGDIASIKSSELPQNIAIMTDATKSVNVLPNRRVRLASLQSSISLGGLRRKHHVAVNSSKSPLTFK
jgi:hypothetical protein